MHFNRLDSVPKVHIGCAFAVHNSLRPCDETNAQEIWQAALRVLWQGTTAAARQAPDCRLATPHCKCVFGFAAASPPLSCSGSVPLTQTPCASRPQRKQPAQCATSIWARCALAISPMRSAVQPRGRPYRLQCSPGDGFTPARCPSITSAGASPAVRQRMRARRRLRRRIRITGCACGARAPRSRSAPPRPPQPLRCAATARRRQPRPPPPWPRHVRRSLPAPPALALSQRWLRLRHWRRRRHRGRSRQPWHGRRAAAASPPPRRRRLSRCRPTAARRRRHHRRRRWRPRHRRRRPPRAASMICGPTRRGSSTCGHVA
jgi:hypothetical protein